MIVWRILKKFNPENLDKAIKIMGNGFDKFGRIMNQPTSQVDYSSSIWGKEKSFDPRF